MATWKMFHTHELGVTVWVDIDEIDMIQHVDPSTVKSESLILPGEDKDPVSIIYTKSKNKIAVKESPEVILQVN